MPKDYNLIARATKLGGEHVHRAANLLTIYQGWHDTHYPELERSSIEAESQLRGLIARSELSRLHTIRL